MVMLRIKLFSGLAALALWITACAPTASPAAPATEPGVVIQSTAVPTIQAENTSTASASGVPLTEAGVPRVTVEDTAAAMQSSEAVIVDVRSLQAYQASHIPGAIWVSLGEIETNPGGLSLDKDQWIITYCT